VCRGYNSTSADACRAAHDDARQRVPIFSVHKDVTDGVSVGVSHSLRDAGLNDAMVDLGSALDIALNASDDVREAALRPGDPVFAQVEHPTWAEELWSRVSATARDLAL
jgi:hypothetical protein